MKISDVKYYINKWIETNYQFYKLVKKNRKYKKTPGIVFNEKYLKNFYQNFKPVFFLSTGRCGTKYLTNILDLNLNTDVYHTPKPELIYYSKYAWENQNKNPDELKHIFDAVRSELMQESYLRNRTYVETNNRITFFCFAISELFPNSKFVHLVRHPGDFVRSGIRRNWYSSSDTQNHGRIVPINKTGWNNNSDIEKISWLWNETNSYIEKFKSNMTNEDRILTVLAENLFSDEIILKQILDFIGLKKHDTQIASQYHSKSVNVQKGAFYPKYDQWDEKEKEQLKSKCTLASKYNYQL